MADDIVTRLEDSAAHLSDIGLLGSSEVCGWAAAEITNLRAELAVKDGAVVVKALEWSDHAPPNGEDCFYDHVRAVTPFGTFSIEWKSWKPHDWPTVDFRGEFLGACPTLDEAKAAAQADYEQRILSSLVSAPSVKDGALSDALRERDEARARLRWNIEDDGKLVRVCEGFHDKTESCEFTVYVPEARASAAEAENEHLRKMLHVYDGMKEISGRSWSGFNIIGDRKSIDEVTRIDHRSAQLETFSKAYEERIAAAEAREAGLRAALRPFANCIFNDNGDITVNFRPFTSEELIAAYFAHRRATRSPETQVEP